MLVHPWECEPMPVVRLRSYFSIRDQKHPARAAQEAGPVDAPGWSSQLDLLYNQLTRGL